MKKTLWIVAALLVVAGPALADVVGSPHDLSSTGNVSFRSNNIDQVCVFCHTPHQPDAFGGIEVDPLWNHTLATTTNYGVYGSSTLNATPTDIGGGSSVSNLCMSCHDGSVGLGNLYNDPNKGGIPSNSGTFLTGSALLGTDLTNDHPINFDFNAALISADGELQLPTDTELFGGTVQCASCHDPHDTTYTPFLITDNAQSAMCLDCHLK